MTTQFLPGCRSSLIGSQPVDDHETAGRLVREYSPEIPVWVQLPVNGKEDMIVQFLPGMPGLETGKKGAHINEQSRTFDDELVSFYEEYLSVTEGGGDINDSRFALTPEYAPGFFVLLKALEKNASASYAVKGQVTGPITLCTQLADGENTAVFYNDQLRDAALKLLSLKAAWQARQLSGFNKPVIIFIDEPALAGFGSSEFTSISKDQVQSCLKEVIDAIHAEGGFAGIHVCANTDWSVILESSADIVNFDTYSYFDKFILYSEKIRRFIQSGGVLAWGIVPTFPESCIEKETTASLLGKLKAQMGELVKQGIPGADLFAQSMITPSCGTGSVSPKGAKKVLELTWAVSERVRREGPSFIEN